MTPTEAFEAWYDRDKSIRLQSKIHSREVWLAACAWQLEEDAKEAEKHISWNMNNPNAHPNHPVGKSTSCGEAISTALRGQNAPQP